MPCDHASEPSFGDEDHALPQSGHATPDREQAAFKRALAPDAPRSSQDDDATAVVQDRESVREAFGLQPPIEGHVGEAAEHHGSDVGAPREGDLEEAFEACAARGESNAAAFGIASPHCRDQRNGHGMKIPEPPAELRTIEEMIRGFRRARGGLPQRCRASSPTRVEGAATKEWRNPRSSGLQAGEGSGQLVATPSANCVQVCRPAIRTMRGS